jgi:PAS domain S-box-containing protein
MWPWLDRVFGEGFMPHGHCYLWSPAMVWAQVISNLFIGFAYASIAATLAALVRRIRDIPFAWVYVAFGVFILSCGLTHWFDVATVWHPIYWADAAVRALTAIASVATALLIVPMVPRAVALAETARVSEERKRKLEAALAELEAANEKLAEREHAARSRAEASDEQFRSLVEAMPQLAWLSGPDGANLYRNARWAEYTGLPLDELRARGWGSVHDPALLGEVEARWAAALTSGNVFEAECRLRGADGGYRWFIARAAPLRDKTGRVDRWVGTCTDIHEQRLQREQALHAARMKDEFLATVSHELRTPLNAILGWSKMLQAGAVPEAARPKALDAIARNAVAQVQLVDDLLDVSRIVSGKMRLDIAPVDPGDAVRAAVDAVRPAAAAKGVDLSTDIDRRAGPTLADGGRLQQVAWNLLANAIKFTPAGGRVDVRVMREGSHVAIVVTDTGAGIRPDFLPYVFDRFSQEDGSIRRRQGGLGIGLAIVKHLVELHGGTVRAESAGEGEGATFVIALPVAPPPPEPGGPRPPTKAAAAPTVVAPPSELKGLRLLIVEDEPDARDLAAAVLAQCGVVVTGAGDVEEALRLLKADAFDVIVSDVGLPGRDGYELMASLRADAAFAKIPAAALTAFAHAEDRRRAIAAGYHMHVAKPVEPADLVAVVADLARIAAATRA